MSQRDSGYERRERDLYETPEWVTEVLCQHFYHSGWGLGCVWEPAAGSGKMLDVLAKYADPGCAFGSDIEPQRAGMLRSNFLTDLPPLWRGPAGQREFGEFGAIITNPPYDLATPFIERALHHFKGRGARKIAMLLRTDFDHAKSRVHLFRDNPAFERKIVLMRRIAWFVEANGKPLASPSYNHAWYIWDHANTSPPKIGYGP